MDRNLGRGKEPAIPLPGFTWNDLDELNADIFEANRTRSRAAIMADFAASFRALVAQVEMVDEKDLDRLLP